MSAYIVEAIQTTDSQLIASNNRYLQLTGQKTIRILDIVTFNED